MRPPIVFIFLQKSNAAALALSTPNFTTLDMWKMCLFGSNFTGVGHPHTRCSDDNAYGTYTPNQRRESLT